ncbi:Endoribonuclease L-PSP [Peniophora sp. CONT]|nr:Endoribonuclease L-PSP [Peniophora sp. CONT]
MQIVRAPDAIPAMPVFSQASISKGFVFVSGNIGCTDDFKVVEGGVQPQTRAALENMKKVLAAAGCEMKHIVKANIYLTDITRDFRLMNEVYKEYFEEGKMPARTCIGVSQLPLPGALVEIECTAELPEA